MQITHDTTVEQYEAWLNTNPSLSKFKIAVRKTFRLAHQTLDRIERLINGRVRRACTAGKLGTHTVYPPSYNKDTTYTRAKLRLWLQGIRFELKLTSLYLEALELADCLDDEIAMEGLKIEALEILRKN
jgi:hypothetical protein